MHFLLCEFDVQLGQGIQPQLKSIGIEPTPVLHEGVEPTARDPAIPPGPEVRERPIPVQPATELTQRIGLKPTTLRDGPHAPSRMRPLRGRVVFRHAR
jgi:hypothetical protein